MISLDVMVDPKRILLIKPSALGDVVHAMPVAHLLKRRFPRAHLAWLIAPAWSQIAERHPDVDSIIHFDRKITSDFKALDKSSHSLFSLIDTLRGSDFDLVVDLQGLLRSAFLGAMTGAATRIGFAYARELAWLGYTHRVQSRGKERHAVERYLDAVEELGCDRSPIRFDFGIDPDDRRYIDELIGPDTAPIVLLPGTNWKTKRWPVEHFDELARRFPSNVFVAGANDVVEIARKIRATSLVGKTTLMQLAELLRRAKLVITNDSGPMHIAAAVGAPLVSLFGPTNPVRTGPYSSNARIVRLNLACMPCYARRCSHHSCMDRLTVDDVMKSINP